MANKWRLTRWAFQPFAFVFQLSRDLRLVCATPADFANEIEPSALGGAKIADQIVAVVTGVPGGRQRTQVYR